MEYFTHLPDFQVIICKECPHAVLPSHIDAHFAAKPRHGLGKKERQRIADEIAEINGLIGNEESLRRCEFLSRFTGGACGHEGKLIVLIIAISWKEGPAHRLIIVLRPLGTDQG
jgi:hypothetical protein